MTGPGPAFPNIPRPPTPTATVTGGEPGYAVVDRRAARTGPINPRTGRTASGLQAGNLQAAMANLRSSGYSMPRNETAARTEAINAAQAMENKTLKKAVDRTRLGTTRQASNVTTVMPKLRHPMGTLEDKQIPFKYDDEKELVEIRRWSRLFYAAHNLVPLLIDIYSRFPLVGLEFECKDPQIKEFYTSMFMDELDYENFLPDQLAREFFTVGEVTTMAHFNESLGTWSSEEILNPDMLDVSRSLFVQRERVQLKVKEMVDALRNGAGGGVDPNETPSQKKDRIWQYQQLEQHYPEIIRAAANDDGLDLSDALVSRIANKISPWDLRGVPPLLRSFRTLMSEESLNAAQDAIADRLYSPFILAKLGVPNLGDGEPWIPAQEDLDNVREDINNALMADMRVIVGNFGLDIQSVFGRENMPRFGEDFDRVDAKLLQAWGIGEALISGGDGGPYASSALNREFVTQMMVSFQNKVKKHIIRRAEVIAEAQEHYDYEVKGAYRRPLYREIVETDPRTGEEHIVRVPKLLLPDVHFQTLNLRDEAQERQFLQQLKASGVPISDRALSINVEIEFKAELEKSSEETVDKLMAQAQAMKKTQDLCDAQGLPYPPELVQHLSATLQLRQGLGQTTMLENQAKALQQQTDQASPAGQMGILPGTVAQGGGQDQGGGGGQQGPPQPQAQGAPPPQSGGGDQGGPPPSGGGGGAPPQGGQAPAGPPAAGPPQAIAASRIGAAGATQPGVPVSAPPQAAGPQASPPTVQGPPIPTTGVELPRNRARPAESDEQRGSMPKGGKRNRRKVVPIDERKSRLERGPSTVGAVNRTNEDRTILAVRRRARIANHRPHSDVISLVADPVFYEATEKLGARNQIEEDFPQILAVRGDYEKMNPKVRESARLLDEGIDAYEAIYSCIVNRPDSL